MEVETHKQMNDPKSLQQEKWEDSNTNVPEVDHPYILMASHGEHKRAVSSVKFAPSILTKQYRNRHAVVCATASADGTVRVWDFQQDNMWSDPAVVNTTAIAETTTAMEVDAENSNANDDMQNETNSSSNNRTATSAVALAGTGGEGVGASSLSATAHSKHSLLNPYVTCIGHTRGINDVCWNPTSPILATASDDKTVRLWDAITGEALVELRGHSSFVFCVDQYQSMAVTGSFDETVKLWDIRSGDCISTIPAHSDPVTAVSFNRDGTVVGSSSHDGLMRLWDVATGECLKTMYAPQNPPVAFLKYAPNGKYILAGTLDSTLRLWPVTNIRGQHPTVHTYKARDHYVNTKYSIVADFTHDGNHLVTGSETGSVVVMDIRTGTTTQVLQGHEDAVLAVSAHDQLPLLCSGGMANDRKIHFWMKRDAFLSE